MTDTDAPVPYAGFLSYSSNDSKDAKWLHQRLEKYSIPKSLRAKLGGRDRLGQFFRDREELPASSSLSEQIRTALARSKLLIVICSSSSAKSIWVSREIEEFKALRPGAEILAVILEGTPPDCFPAGLRTKEPIAADLRPEFDGREGGFLKLAAGIIGIPLGVLRDREVIASRRRRMVLMLLVAMFAVLVVASVFGLISSLA